MNDAANGAAGEPLFNGMKRKALAFGVAALGVCIIGAPFSPQQFFRAYLAAYQFLMCITLGSIVALMIYHVTGGAWGFMIRRILEAGTRCLPLMALLFIPICFGLQELYLWARPEVVQWNKNIQYKQIYLNVPFFLARAIFYFACWLILVYFLNRWSRFQEEADDRVVFQRLRTLSSVGLVVYGITITFAAIDWVMSLQPTFRSTIFGPLVAAGSLLGTLSFAVLVFAPLSKRPPLAEFASPFIFKDLGNLMLTFVVIFFYMNFFQFMLVWIANLRAEVLWYLPRTRNGWQWVALAIVTFAMFVPFFYLLSSDLKRQPETLVRIARLNVFMQLVFNFYQIMPPFIETHIEEHWMDFLTPIGLGGLWFAYFLWQLESRPLLVAHDPNRVKAIELRDLWLEEQREEQEDADV